MGEIINPDTKKFNRRARKEEIARLFAPSLSTSRMLIEVVISLYYGACKIPKNGLDGTLNRVGALH